MADWKTIILNVAQSLRGNVAYSIHLQQRRIIRGFFAFVFIAVGSIFFLNALAVALGSWLGDNIWLGYLLVGVLMMVIGYFIKEKNKI